MDGLDPELNHARRTRRHANETVPESLRDAREEIQEKVGTVSQAEVEEFLSLAVRLFLHGGAYLHYEGSQFPRAQIKVSDDTIRVSLSRLDRAVAWRLAGPEEPPVPEGPEEALLQRWRVVVEVDEEVVAALGRGIPGVQVSTGRASWLLFRNFVRGLLADKTALRRRRTRAALRDLPDPKARPPAGGGHIAAERERMRQEYR